MFQCFLPKKNLTDADTKLLYFANNISVPSLPHRMFHSHDDRAEIIFVTKGRGFHTIGNRTYHTQQGDIILINPGIVHEEVADKDAGMQVYCCGISGFGIGNAIPNTSVPILHAADMGAHFFHILQLMYDQISKDRNLNHHICHLLLQTLISMLHQIPTAGELTTPSGETFNPALRIKAYLDEHFRENISMDDVADALGMSTSYMAHSFKNATGFSPNRYIMQRRVGEAQTLLTITNEPVTYISGEVGYDNSNYFSTMFTKMVSMSPSEYRRFWKNAS